MTYTKVIVEADGSITEHEYTKAEIDDSIRRIKQVEAEDAKLAKLETDRKAAKDKLLALGLSIDDLKVLGLG